MKLTCRLCKTETDTEVGEWTCAVCGMQYTTQMDYQGKPWTQISRRTGKAMEYTLRQDARAVLASADWLKSHADAFPDLYQHTNRWKKERWASKHANAKVTACDIGHNCGCCSDSPLEIWPYLEVDGRRVYSDPPVFTVGEAGYSGGDRAYSGWAHKMRDVGISEAVIAQVKAYFGKQIQQRRLQLESELEDAADAEEQAEAKAEMEALNAEAEEET